MNYCTPELDAVYTRLLDDGEFTDADYQAVYDEYHDLPGFPYGGLQDKSVILEEWFMDTYPMDKEA